MNKNLIILGAVAVLGVGAFLYFKGKKTDEEIEQMTSEALGEESGTNSTETATSSQNSVVKPIVKTDTGTSTIVDVPMDKPIPSSAEINKMTNQDVLDYAEAKVLASDIKKYIQIQSRYKKSSSKQGIQRAEIDPRIAKITALGYKALPNGTAIRI